MRMMQNIIYLFIDGLKNISGETIASVSRSVSHIYPFEFCVNIYSRAK